MYLNRRKLLVTGLAAMVVPRVALAELSPDGFQIIRAKIAALKILAGGTAETRGWRWDQDSSITVLRGKQGQEMRLRFVNLLEKEIWLHWFGVRGPSELMTLNIQPGESNAVDCVFTPPDAGTFWFGPLLDVSRQRDMGLCGMLVIEEAQSPGDFSDIPIVLDDWLLDEKGEISDNFGNLQMAVGEGRLGNWFTLNNGHKPNIAMDRAKPARLRLLNVSNVRSMGLLFKGVDPWLMSVDGQPVPLTRVGVEALRLAPGQRADLLLEPGDERIILALDLFEDIVEIGVLEWVGASSENVLPDNFSLTRNPIATTEALETARRQVIKLAGGAKGGLKSAKVGVEELDTRALLERGLAWAMNGIAGTGGPALFTAKVGEVLILEFDNLTAFPQPLHIHGHVWQLIREDGEVKENQPWRDTVVVPGLAKAELLFVADNPGLWAIQSLMAERSDAGLLGSFQVQG